jgi:hypothetical protein
METARNRCVEEWRIVLLLTGWIIPLFAESMKVRVAAREYAIIGPASQNSHWYLTNYINNEPNDLAMPIRIKITSPPQRNAAPAETRHNAQTKMPISKLHAPRQISRIKAAKQATRNPSMDGNMQ